MPYIPPTDRKKYDGIINKLNIALGESDWNPGHVNYVVTRIIHRWFAARRKYATINAIEGVLNCVAKEFYRKKAFKYEEEKEAENGSIG